LDEIADSNLSVDDAGYFDSDEEESMEDLESEFDPYGFEMEEDINL